MKLVEMLTVAEVKGLEEVKATASPFADIEAMFLASEAINKAIEMKAAVKEEEVEMVEAKKEVKTVRPVRKAVKKGAVKAVRNKERINKFFEMIEKMAQRTVVIEAAQKEAKKLFNAVPFEFFIQSMERLAEAKNEYKVMEGFVMKGCTTQKIERASITQSNERGIKRISTSKQLAKAINILMHQGDSPYFNKINISTDLDVNGKGETVVNAVPATNSRFAVMFDYMTKHMQIDLDGYKVKVGEGTGNYVTTDVVYVSCKDCGNDMLSVIDQVRKYGLYKLGKDIFFPSYIGGKLEVRLGSPRGEIVEAVEVEGGLKIDGKIATHYTFFNASPSQDRVGDFMCIDETKYGLESKIAKTLKVNKFTILDDILGGALSYVMSKGEMPLAKALKIGSRLALHNTAAVELGRVGNEKYGVLYIQRSLKDIEREEQDVILVNEGKLDPKDAFKANDTHIKGANDYTQEMLDILDNLGVDIDEAIVDGQGWILADMIIDYFNEANVEVRYDAIKGSGLQMRTEGINDKVFNLVISSKERDILVENFLAKYECVVVGNKDNIAYIIDGNGAKLPNMWRFDEVDALANGVEYGNFMMNILAVADDSSANASIQAIGKVVNDGVINVLANNQYNSLVNSLDRIIKGSVSMNGKSARAQKMFAANPERSMNSHVTHKMLLSELSDQAMAAAKNVKIPVEGVNSRAFFDNTFLYTGDDQSIFKVREGGVVEAYSKSVVKMFRKELKAIYAEYLEEIASIDVLLDAQEIAAVDAVTKKAIAKTTRTTKVNQCLNSMTVKYPCPTDIEFANFRYLADFEVIEAIDALNTTDAIKQLLKDMILGLNDGIVMIAPLNTLKHKLAGMDTDFDGVTSFFERCIVESSFAKTFNDVVYIDKKGAMSIYNPDYVVPQAQDSVVEESIEF